MILCRIANEGPMPTAKHGDYPRQEQIAMRSALPIIANSYTVIEEHEELGCY